VIYKPSKAFILRHYLDNKIINGKGNFLSLFYKKMNSIDKKNNFQIKLNIFFDNNIETNNQTFNLIVRLHDVTFEDVIDNIIYEVKKEINLKEIKNKKLEFLFTTELQDLNKIYSFFIIADIDKNNEISIGDYISMERHAFEVKDNISSLSIKLNRVDS